MSDIDLGTARGHISLEASGVQAGVGQAQAALNSLNDVVRNNWWGLRNVGLALAAVGAAAVSGLGEAVGAAASWEDAMARIEALSSDSAKSSEQNAAAMGQVSDQLKQVALNTVTPIGQLAKIAEGAAGVGLSSDKISKFTQVVDQLANTTDASVGTTTQALARFTAAMGLTGDDVTRLGSTLYELNRRSPATAENIETLAQRMVGVAAASRLTAPEVLAISSAVAAVTSNTRSGVAAINGIFKSMSEGVQQGGASLQRFAEISGVSAAQFSQQYKQDAASALVIFLQGLDRLKNAGVDIRSVLEGVGVSGAQQQAILAALAQTEGNTADQTARLSTQLQVAQTAWNGNNTLADAAQKRYQTLTAQLNIMKNSIVVAFQAFGEGFLPVLKVVAQAVADVAVGFANLPAPIRTTLAIIISLIGVLSAFAAIVFLVGPRIVLIRSALQQLTQVYAELTPEAQAAAAAAAAHAAAEAEAAAAARANMLALQAERAEIEANFVANNATSAAQNRLALAQAQYGEAAAKKGELAVAAGQAEYDQLLLTAQALGGNVEAEGELEAASARAAQAERDLEVAEAREAIAADAVAKAHRDVALAESDSAIAAARAAKVRSEATAAGADIGGAGIVVGADAAAGADTATAAVAGLGAAGAASGTEVAAGAGEAVTALGLEAVAAKEAEDRLDEAGNTGQHAGIETASGAATATTALGVETVAAKALAAANASAGQAGGIPQITSSAREATGATQEATTAVEGLGGAAAGAGEAAAAGGKAAAAGLGGVGEAAAGAGEAAAGAGAAGAAAGESIAGGAAAAAGGLEAAGVAADATGVGLVSGIGPALNVIGGLVLVAGLATTALGLFGASHRKAAQDAAQQASADQDLTHILQQQGTAANQGAAQWVIQQLTMTQALAVSQRLGISIKDIIAIIEGTAPANVVNDFIDKTNKGGEAARKLAEQVQLLFQVFQSSSSAAAAQAAANADLQTSADGAASGTDALGGALTDTQKQIDKQYQASISLVDAMMQSQSAAFSVQDAENQLADAEYNASKGGLELAKASLDVERAQLDEVKASRQLQQANEDLITARQRQQQATDDAASAYEQAVQRLNDANDKLAEDPAKIARSISDAEQKVEDANDKLAEAPAKIAQSIADAEEKLSEANDKLAEAPAEVAKSIQDAEQKVEDANLRLADAQAKLKEALSPTPALELADAYNKIGDAALRLRDDTKTVADAQWQLNYLIQEGASGRDIQDARDTLDKANQQQKDDTNELAKARDDYNQKLSQDPQKIADAQRAVADAIRAQQDALQGVQDAQKAGTKTMLDATRAQQDAQRALVDAQKAGTKELADDTRAQQDAVQALQDAQKAGAKTMVDDSRAQEDATRAVEKAQRDYQKALDDQAADKLYQEALLSVRDAQLGVKSASLQVAEANQRVVDTQRQQQRAAGDIAKAEFGVESAILAEAKAHVEVRKEAALARGETFGAKEEAQALSDELGVMASHASGPVRDKILAMKKALDDSLSKDGKDLIDGTPLAVSPIDTSHVDDIGKAFEKNRQKVKESNKGLLDDLKSNWDLIPAAFSGPVGVAYEVWKHFGGEIKRIGGDAIDWISTNVPKIPGIVGREFSKLPEQAGHAGEAMGRIVRSVFGDIGTFFTKTVPQWDSTIERGIQRIPDILSGGLREAVKAVEREGPKILTFFERLPGQILGFVEHAESSLAMAGARLIGGFIKGLTGKDLSSTLSGIGDSVSGFVDRTVGLIGSIPGRIGGFLGQAALLISSTFSGAWNDVSTFTSGAVEGIAGWVGSIPGRIGGFLSQIGSNIRTAFSTAWSDVSTFTSGAVEGIAGFVGSIPGRIGGFLSQIGSNIRTAFSTAWSDVSTFTSGAVEGIAGWIGSIPGRIGGALSQIGSDIRGTFSGAWNDVSNFVSGGINNIVSWLSGMPGRIAGALGNLFDPLWQSFRTVWDDIAKWWNSLRLGFNLPSVNIFGQTLGGGRVEVGTWPPIPYLAAGGLLDKPTMVMAGEAGPEAVIPLNELWTRIERLVSVMREGFGTAVGSLQATLSELSQHVRGGSASDTANLGSLRDWITVIANTERNIDMVGGRVGVLSGGLAPYTVANTTTSTHTVEGDTLNFHQVKANPADIVSEATWRKRIRARRG